MQYFMIAWESYDPKYYPNAKSDTQIRESFINQCSKSLPIESESAGEAEFKIIGKDLQVLTYSIANVIFLKTDNDDLTEQAIFHWIANFPSASICFAGRDLFIKQVCDPYPLPRLAP